MLIFFLTFLSILFFWQFSNFKPLTPRKWFSVFGVLINLIFFFNFLLKGKAWQLVLKVPKIRIKNIRIRNKKIKMNNRFFFPRKNGDFYWKFSVDHESKVCFFYIRSDFELKIKLRVNLRTCYVLSLYHVFCLILAFSSKTEHFYTNL